MNSQVIGSYDCFNSTACIQLFQLTLSDNLRDNTAK